VVIPQLGAATIRILKEFGCTAASREGWMRLREVKVSYGGVCALLVESRVVDAGKCR